VLHKETSVEELPEVAAVFDKLEGSKLLEAYVKTFMY